MTNLRKSLEDLQKLWWETMLQLRYSPVVMSELRVRALSTSMCMQYVQREPRNNNPEKIFRCRCEKSCTNQSRTYQMFQIQVLLSLWHLAWPRYQYQDFPLRKLSLLPCWISWAGCFYSPGSRPRTHGKVIIIHLFNSYNEL